MWLSWPFNGMCPRCENCCMIVRQVHSVVAKPTLSSFNPILIRGALSARHAGQLDSKTLALTTNTSGAKFLVRDEPVMHGARCNIRAPVGHNLDSKLQVPTSGPTSLSGFVCCSQLEEDQLPFGLFLDFRFPLPKPPCPLHHRYHECLKACSPVLFSHRG